MIHAGLHFYSLILYRGGPRRRVHMGLRFPTSHEKVLFFVFAFKICFAHHSHLPHCSVLCPLQRKILDPSYLGLFSLFAGTSDPLLLTPRSHCYGGLQETCCNLKLFSAKRLNLLHNKNTFFLIASKAMHYRWLHQCRNNPLTDCLRHVLGGPALCTGSDVDNFNVTRYS